MNTSGQRVTGSVQLSGAIQGLALSPSGASLLAASTNGSVWLLDATTLKILASGVPGGRLQDVAFSKNAGEIYVASEDGWVDLLDGSSLQRISRITLDGMAPFGLAVTPDDAQLYVTSPLSGQLAIIDRSTRALKQTIRVAGSPRRVAFNAIRGHRHRRERSELGRLGALTICDAAAAADGSLREPPLHFQCRPLVHAAVRGVFRAGLMHDVRD